MLKPGKLGGETALGTALPDDEYFNLLGRVATGEAKLTVASSFAVRPDKHFNGRELSKELAQLSPDSWVPNWRTVSGYCDISLEPAGVVELLPNWTSQYNKQYQATELGSSIGLGLAGVVLPWSLDNPGLSTHHAFSTNNGRGHQHAARVRYMILSYLLDRHETVSLRDIVEDLDHEFAEDAVTRHINSLDQHGLIKHVSKQRTYNPIFALTKPQPSLSHIKRAETRRIYEVLDRLYTNGARKISFVTLLERCIEDADDSIDPAVVRESLTIAAARPSNLPALRAVEPKSRGLTKIKLRSEVHTPLQLLFDSLEDFKANPRRKQLQGTAKDIVTDELCVGELFDKWARISSKVKRLPEQDLVRVRRIVRRLGTATLPDIYAAMQATDSTLSRPTIELRANTLVEQGKLEDFTLSTDPTKKSRQRFFREAS
jgi:Fe2+ or Zn2+ uptake regulation protein